jgi:ABC-2 type transport system ATP-binding protein
VTAVELRGLQKRFGAKLAVDGVDLDVPAGSFFGVVGPNGAGKTTTLRMTTGLLRPDAGTAVVAGIDVWRDPVTAKARMGILPEQPRFFERLSGAELLTYNGLLRDMARDVVAQRSAELLGVLGLADDEPFESVDPVSSRTIRTLLERFTASGGTVVFSSHVMETVERLCDRVVVMHAGRVVAAGTTDEVSSGRSLEDAFFALVGATPDDAATLGWFDSSSR